MRKFGSFFKRNVDIFVMLLFLSFDLFGGWLFAQIIGDSIIGTIAGHAVMSAMWVLYYTQNGTGVYHRDLKATDILLWTAVLVPVWISSQAGSMWILERYPDSFDAYQSIVDTNPWGYMALALIAAPIAEEVLFRGAWYGLLRKKHGVVPACIVSSVVFALMHGTLPQFYLGLMVGVMLCAVYESTGSLWASIGFHMVYNFATMFVHWRMQTTGFALAGIQIYSWIVLFAMLWWVRTRALRLQDGSIQLLP